MKTSAVIFMAFFVAKFSVSATFPNAGNEQLSSIFSFSEVTIV